MSVVKVETIKSGTVTDGVYYESFKGTTTNDAQTISNQRISWVKKEASANAKIVAWSKLGKTGIVGANLLALALDFETNNPGWHVLAGINGDYYDPTTKTPINALVQQGDVVKATNFSLSRYFSVGFLDNSQSYMSSKINISESKYALSIYDDTNTQIISEVLIQGINTFPSAGQTSIYFNSPYPYQIANARYFRINDLEHVINYGSYLFKGTVFEEVEDTQTDLNELVIVSLDEEVQTLLANNPSIRIQKHLKEANNGLENVIGVGSQPLKDGTILEFGEINDQNIDFAKQRAPRSTIGFTENGDFVMSTIDGRQALMAGADLREEAMVMESLGCKQAFNLDGGGSTQLIVRENNQLVMLNSPSEIYRSNANGLLLVEPDVYVDASITDLNISSLHLQYSLTSSEEVIINNHTLYLNNVAIDSTSENLTVDSLISSGINYLSIVVKYEKQGIMYEHCLWSERINLANYGFVEEVIKVKPHNFQIEFVKDDTINGFSAIVNFDDPDKTLTKLYVAYADNQEIAIKDYRGYVVDFYNVANPSSFTFSIIYYYRINTINAVFETFETTFPYTYEVIDDPIIEPEPDPEEKPKGCLQQTTIMPFSALLLGIFLLWKKGRKNG
ncbi:MAG: phosphodiester glycosidase family protein [Bacilli bacterium]